MKIFVAIIVSCFALFCNGFIVVPKGKASIPVKVARNVPFALAPQNFLVNKAKQKERIGFVLFASSNQNIEWKIDDLIEDKLDYRNYGGNLPEGLFSLTANEMDDIFEEGEIDGYLEQLKDMKIETLQQLKPLLIISNDSQKAQEARKVVVAYLRINMVVLSEMIRDASTKLRTTINPPKAYNVNITRTPIYGLEKQYNSTMKCSNALLFKSWEYYKSSLPQRKWGNVDGEYICLAENEYWARDEDLDLMVDSLLRTRDNKRALIKYISAPSESGKTSSVAAAFVRSTQNHNETKQFSYYLYLPCENNNGRNFRYTGWVSQDEDEAENQGAQFAFECVEKLLNMEKLEPKKKVSPAESIDDASKRIKELLEEKNIQGKVLFHLDEHKKMKESNPNFRRGAMSALAYVVNATLLSTFTAIPLEIPTTKSSAACRDPTPFPPLDVRRVVQTLEQFSFPAKSFSAENKRLYATLMFRLAFYLSKKLIIIHLNTDKEFETFKSEFRKASEAARTKPLVNSVVKSALKACLDTCQPPDWSPDNSTSLAASLLVGIQEKKYNGKLPFTVAFRSLGNVYFTSPLNELLETKLPRQEQGYSAFSKGRSRFLALLWGEIDIISGTPLECAYAWTLCAFAIANQEIQIPKTLTTFSIKCDKLEPGRLFDNSSIGSFSDESANNLDMHSIYFAKEGSGSQSTSHPICDIFFRTEANELVMIDVTGSASEQKIEKKINQKRDFLEQRKHNNFQLRCFVFAPLYDGKYDGNGSSMLVSGENARRLLGGLAPILSWYNEDWEKDDVIEI